MILSNREKSLLLVLGIILAMAVLYFGVRSLLSHESALVQRIAQQERLLARAEALENELAKVTTPPRRNRRNQPLISYVEQLAARTRLRDRVQLNLIARRAEKNLEGIEIKVSDLTLDEMMNLIYALENDNAGFVIEHLELSPAFKSKTRLRVLARVLALKP